MLLQHGHAITYASGLAAAFSVGARSYNNYVVILTGSSQALTYYKPKRIAISGGYLGCHGAIDIYLRGRPDNNTSIISLEDDFQEGDLCWLETPLNPTGESR